MTKTSTNHTNAGSPDADVMHPHERLISVYVRLHQMLKLEEEKRRSHLFGIPELV